MSDVIAKPDYAAMFRLEEAIKTLPPVEVPTGHAFCTGLYARTVFIPAGTLLTGAIHKDECFFLVRSGAILITTDGEPIKAEAGFMAITKAGAKRAGLALTDTCVTTFHANPGELRDPGELWDAFTVPPTPEMLAAGHDELEGT